MKLLEETKLIGNSGSSEMVKSRVAVFKSGNGSGVPDNKWSSVKELSSVAEVK